MYTCFALKHGKVSCFLVKVCYDNFPGQFSSRIILLPRRLPIHPPLLWYCLFEMSLKNNEEIFHESGSNNS